NLRGSRAHVSATIACARPSLPIHLSLPDDPSPSAKPSPSSGAYDPSTPGPQPPRSWTLTKPAQAPSESPHWRLRALSLVLPLDPPRVPSLVSLCLRGLAALPTHEFVHDIVPWLAPHLRRELIRHAAVHAPLGGAKLWPLYEPNGHADTEIIVVGPYATLRDDYFIRGRITTEQEQTVDGGGGDGDWDMDDDPSAEPLSTLVLMSTPLSTWTLLSLPPTLTRLALLHLPSPVPLHRIPRTCPLLAVLDLSYSAWLSTTDDSDRAFERVEWRRWSSLRVLGLRECAVSSAVLGKVNAGRWDDVEVVLQ
ncbi:hypothetical protein H0H87_005995, partial [Tephrocybe sp. NHM501043]